MQGKIYLYLHPDDYEFLLKSKTELERYLSEEQNLVIRQNPGMPLGSINVESDEEIISRSIEEQFKLIEENLNEQIENRQAHLNEVDIDAHDFNLTPDHYSNTAKIESANSQNLKISDESLIQENTEQETTSEEFGETEKNDYDVRKSDSKDSVLEDGALKPVEESNNISQEVTDVISDSIEKKPPEQNIQSALPTELEGNTEFEKNEDGSKDS